MKSYDIAAYVWPAYTGNDNRAKLFWNEGIGEWQTVINVKQNSLEKPADYVWDRSPVWGFGFPGYDTKHNADCTP